MSLEFKPSTIFPEAYDVYSDGRVYSKRNNRFICPNKDKFGYLYYVLCVKGERKTVKAHRLVALSFIPNPYNKPTVNHKNGVRDDNRAINLEWATNKEQTNDPLTKYHLDIAHSKTDYRTMGLKRNFGRKSVKITRLSDGFTKTFGSHLEASKFIGCGSSKITECLNGHRKSTKGYEIEEFPIAVTKRHFPEKSDADRTD